MDGNTENHTHTYPHLSEYYGNLTPFITGSMFIATFILTLIIAIFCTTIAKLSKRVTVTLFIPSAFLCSIYPIIAIAALATILVPQSWFICHTVMHLSFTVGAVVFHNLCYRYVSSEAVFIKEVDSEYAMNLQTPPVCCCCMCLPKLLPTKTKLAIVKCLIWQMPIVQTSIMIVLNIMYYHKEELYDNISIYFMPFILGSITTGLWGLNITVRMVNNLVPDYNLMRKMLCLQLIVLLCKLQYLILYSQLDAIDFGGEYPITNTIYKQSVLSLIILAEMVLVSILAQNAYSKPVEL